MPEMHKVLDLVLIVEEKKKPKPQFTNLRAITSHFIILSHLLCTKCQKLGDRYLAPLSESSPPPAKVTMNFPGKETDSGKGGNGCQALPLGEGRTRKVLISPQRKKQAQSDGATQQTLNRGGRRSEFL